MIRFQVFVRDHDSSKQLNIETDGAHEKIDVGQTLAGHCWWQCLCKAHSLHDTVLDGHDEALLLIWTGSNADRSKELPDIHVLAGVDSTWENER